jgi:hypothetical protein
MLGYLRAMRATALLPHPEGSFPTPACPNPPALPAPPQHIGDQAGQVGGDAVMTVIAEAQAIQSAKLDRIVDLLVQQKTIKEWYSTSEVAKALGKAKFTVREWCRLGQCQAEKRKPYRGGKKQWMIPHQELLRLDGDGPAPMDTFTA